MIIRRLNRIYSLILGVTRYAAPVLRIYTRTFVSSRHRYTEGYIQVVKKNVTRTKPIALRYCKGSEFVQMLTAAAFDFMSDNMLIDEWYAYQWDMLYRSLLAVIQHQYTECMDSSTSNTAKYRRSPDTINNYKIEEKIGDVSTCATIYKAQRGTQHVALKAMFNFNCDDEADMLRYENFGAELITEELGIPSHPNIIQINAYFVSENKPYTKQAEAEYSAVFYSSGYGKQKTLFLEMPLYLGSLSQYLASRDPLSDSEVVWLLFQLISSVHHISRYNIVHRDIKLDNILVKQDTDGSVVAVLTDFGMAHDSLATSDHPHDRKWGNPQIMPPEVANSRDIRQGLDYSKSDIWCVGSLVYGLCGQDNPFSSLSSTSYRSTDLAELESNNVVLKLLAYKMLSYDTDQRLSAHQSFLICGAMIWLPDIFHSTHNMIERVARELVVLSWEVMRSDFRGHEQIMLMYFLQHASAKSICVALNEL